MSVQYLGAWEVHDWDEECEAAQTCSKMADDYDTEVARLRELVRQAGEILRTAPTKYSEGEGWKRTEIGSILTAIDAELLEAAP